MENISLELIEMLAKKMNERELNEITLEKGDEKITLKKEIKYITKEVINDKPISKEKKGNVVSTKTSEEKAKGNIVIAPMSGTFYRSPAPGEPHFVQEGDEVNSGDVVCIIEAMKMMNDVICKYSGKVVKILVENGEIVQKGDKLFVIE
ncbi:acetyl-CoA carboxylase biotin carboxyl carrier protein [Fusobacterium perfoetens]|uniref:acetyl-CoA carboxylase biotin carboxyl carrier protein n=1 Tax=Fusobacterium perfoetens TaxID=852 RepID=UPI00047F183D|nr:acetyl-CoA carboxylase biotin carboxyl carrier protein [Fusobacterium perfoetens]MCI6153097.1 acetyl-CoA carboxylase biotin carboxyl carrier protein [Fusobacterium perfoetens]MDY3236909.1 acetyl-CoA carboxylase biotin carboxyl carrier protein [Fusobacterium perfoetens]